MPLNSNHRYYTLQINTIYTIFQMIITVIYSSTAFFSLSDLLSSESGALGYYTLVLHDALLQRCALVATKLCN